MITLSGKSVFGGVAIGKIAFYKRQEKQVRRYHVEDTEADIVILRLTPFKFAVTVAAPFFFGTR